MPDAAQDASEPHTRPLGRRKELLKRVSQVRILPGHKRDQGKRPGPGWSGAFGRQRPTAGKQATATRYGLTDTRILRHHNTLRPMDYGHGVLDASALG